MSENLSNLTTIKIMKKSVFDGFFGIEGPTLTVSVQHGLVSKDEFESDESSFFENLVATNRLLEFFDKVENVRSTFVRSNLITTKFFWELEKCKNMSKNYKKYVCAT